MDFQAAWVTLVAALVMLLAVHLMARVAVRVLAKRLREVTDPEHLRAAGACSLCRRSTHPRALVTGLPSCPGRG